MSTKPLAEDYEKLKEFRRQGGPDAEAQLEAGHELRALYDDVVGAGVPGQAAGLTRKLDATYAVRVLEIRTLAERVFGDGRKATGWLQRPNVSLAGQKPMDLLKDELGAAVVREMLEQIDHGIFA